MSQRRVLEYVFLGNTRGVEAALNRIDSGINRSGGNTRKMTRDLGMMDRQLQAIGTTARYAFAGGLVFGITGAIQRLTDFQSQLGTVAGLTGTIGAQGQYQAPRNSAIQRMGDEAQLAAIRTGVATADVEQYMQRFFSTFSYQNPSGKRALSDMRSFVNEVTRLQALMGIEAGDPQALAGGIAGFVNQIDPAHHNVAKNTNRVANLITELTAATPNITGRDIARDIGRIGATMNMTGLTPEQTFAIWAQAGKAGGSASVIGRGVAQMLGNLLHPTGKQVAGYQALGLPTDPNSLRAMGTENVLRAMMRAATTGNVRVGRRSALIAGENDDDATAATALDRAGISGINLNAIYQVFGRQESARQFINLLSQDGVRGLDNFTRSLKTAEDQNRAYSREQAAIGQNPLRRFGEARANISLSLARGIAQPLGQLARPVSWAAEQLAAHPVARNVVDAALAGALLGGSLRRLRRNRLTGGGQGAAAAALSLEAAPNLAGFVEHPTGSRDNPMWVMIHPASWYIGSPGGDPAKQAEGRRSFASKAAGVAAKAAPAVGGAAAGSGFAAGDIALAGTGIGLPAAILLAAAHYGGKNGPLTNNVTRAMDRNSRQGLTGSIYGSLSVETRLVDAQGKTITTQQHDGVPVKFWTPNSSMPTAKGKPGTRRSR